MCENNGMDVLFRVSLAILKIGEEDLLCCQSLSSVYSVLESLPTRMWDADKLLKVGQVLLVLYYTLLMSLFRWRLSFDPYFCMMTLSSDELSI
jgi:hypothetical protein